jgi:hypothetical protein
MTQVLGGGKKPDISLTEYFVYYRWQLIPGKDIRKHIRPEHLLAVDIEKHALTKKRALICFKSQTTCFFDWQDRPILPDLRLDETCHSPELFLRSSPDYPGASVFAGPRFWIRLVHGIEPSLKRSKDQALAFWDTVASMNSRM